MSKIPYKGQALFSPKMDLVFKTIFGAEENEALLRSFLNNLLNLDIDDNDKLILSNTELVVDHPNDKLSRLDVRVARYDKNNHILEQIDIEIQLANEGNMIKRSVFYLSRLYAGQLKKKGNYADLGRAITLNILDFTLFDDDTLTHCARLKDVQTNEELTDCIEVNFVELPKLARNIKCPVTLKEQWLFFLNAEKEEEIEMLVNQNSQVRQAVDCLQKISADARLQYEYDMREKAILDYNSGMAYATETGIEIGLQRGLQQGQQRGFKQGVFSMARRMKAMDVPMADIVMITGLTEREIEHADDV